MPYKIEPRDGKYEVVKEATGEVVGTHATRAKAEAQMRALYASEGNKSGARNNRRDRITIRTIRQQAQALIELTNELEPSETDEPDEAAEMDALQNLIGDNTIDLKYAKSIRADILPDVLAVKSVGANEIKGYSQLWGSPQVADLDVEYFTPQTDFWDGTLGKAARPLTWDHAQDASFKGSPVIGQITDFGDDEIGRWYIAKLDENHKYRKAIDALIKAGRLGTSSDSAPQYVERVKTGKATWLKTWPFFAAALTTQPCEPRMLSDGSPEFLKSLGISLPDAPEAARELLQYRTRLLKLKAGA